jgi:hypothetical protein
MSQLDTDLKANLPFCWFIHYEGMMIKKLKVSWISPVIVQKRRILIKIQCGRLKYYLFMWNCSIQSKCKLVSHFSFCKCQKIPSQQLIL